jgi:polyhydroxyalkanoate synthesis repressor PhaR
MSEETRIIKKYPNRRLYDTAISRYITLEDIKVLVLENVDFKVVDAKTEDDLTNNTLLQIILEQEGSQSPIFTREILQNVIRFYGDSMQDFMSNYLEQSVHFFLEQQNKFKQGTDVLFGTNPLNLWKEFAERNMSFWQSMQEAFLHPQQGMGDAPSETKANDENK